MTKTQIIDFLYKVICTEERQIIPIVKFSSDMHVDCPCETKKFFSKDKNNTDIFCIIKVNRKWFMNSRNDIELKGCLLHEVGHCFFKDKSKYKNELFAHLWAIDKAETMRLKKVRQELIAMIMNWGDFEWGDYNMRRYILASNKFKEIINGK